MTTAQRIAVFKDFMESMDKCCMQNLSIDPSEALMPLFGDEETIQLTMVFLKYYLVRYGRVLPAEFIWGVIFAHFIQKHKAAAAANEPQDS